ncbi:hypothetical protein PR048_004588 [Dryococelus australis]|uniref:DDE-1 domain-containing protein n=1 Tax=Dryococelus australis TaxID=614101 RepID=A0ABQ9I5U4_9NEOP|nr:hypothetical protein PR048_004588 [Dryococelus australis]
MDSSMVLDWIKCVCLGQRGMLVLNSFHGHVTSEVKASLQKEKTDLVIIPEEDYLWQDVSEEGSGTSEEGSCSDDDAVASEYNKWD